MFKFTNQQENINDKFLFSSQNIFINASPGTGKSFTMITLAKQIQSNKKCIFLAFNKSISEDLKIKLPEHIECSTIHALSYSILRTNTQFRAKLSEIKKFIVATKIFSDRKLQPKYLFKISDIVNLCQMNLVSDKIDILNLCNVYGVDVDDSEVNDVLSLIDKVDRYDASVKNSIIDYTDMLYLTLKKVSEQKFPKYDYIFVDECQDISPLQRELILRLRKGSTRLIVAGDEKQCIYSFQGSNLDSLIHLKNLPNTIQMPLSITFRCGKNIVKESHKYFNEIEAHESNCDGIVRNGSHREACVGDFIVCRNNLPLIECFVDLVSLGKRCYILGRDLEKSLIDMLNDINDVSDTQRILIEKYDKLKSSGIKDPLKNKSYIDLLEKCKIISVLLIRYGSINNLKTNIYSIFSDNEVNGIMLMTSHKSKGLEADRVFFLNKELIPSKYAETELEKYQEKCLAFVTVTRAKKELIYCNINM